MIGGEMRAVFAVCVTCSLVLVLGEVLHRRRAIASEWTRKLVHVLMGLVASTFPWLFGEVRSVILVCGAFAVLLGASLLTRGLPSVHRVDRRTAGAVWFPLAVAAVFVAGRGRPDLYATAILVLALADPAAATVGRTCGATRYGPAHDARSLEGSLAFLLVASAVVCTALLLTTPMGVAAALAWALAIGIVLAGLEAVAPAGSDNLLIPFGALLCLRFVSPGGPLAPAAALAAVLAVATAALCVPAAPRERADA